MILVVSMNLAIDQTIYLDRLEIGQIHRSRLTRREAGSKGVNVARVLQTLGVPPVLTGFLGGAAGEFVAQSLAREGIACTPCPIQDESRSCYILVENETSRQTVVNELGPSVSLQEAASFLLLFRSLLDDSESVLLCGSLPPGVPEETYGQMISLAHTAGKQVLLDSSGAALRYAVEAGPFLLKINQAEAATLLGHPVHDPASAAKAARGLCQGNTSLVMITLGAEGAVFVSRQESYFLAAPRIEARNSVGSGDATFAGVTAGLVRRLPLDQTGVLGVAAGAANALRGGGHCTLDEITQLRAQVRCTPIDLKG